MSDLHGTWTAHRCASEYHLKPSDVFKVIAVFGGPPGNRWLRAVRDDFMFTISERFLRLIARKDGVTRVRSTRVKRPTSPAT